MLKLMPPASGRFSAVPVAAAVLAAALGLSGARAADITDQRGRTYAFDAPAKPVVVQRADLYSDPKWHDVAAVKEHRVYRMPLGGHRWDPPSQESARL